MSDMKYNENPFDGIHTVVYISTDTISWNFSSILPENA